MADESAEVYATPATVQDFLAQHTLSQYADAFIEEGWDSLAQLLSLSEVNLQVLITDTKMKSGHATRLRTALEEVRWAHAAPSGYGVPAGQQLPPLPWPPHQQPPPQQPPPQQPPPQQPSEPAAGVPPTEETLGALQQHFYEKLVSVGPLGEPKHGTIVQTYNNPMEPGEVYIKLALQGNLFYCCCCPWPPGSVDGARAAGNSYSNIWSHMGSRAHWERHRRRAIALAPDISTTLPYKYYYIQIA